jgi:1,4-alpha-glucan branching enzyme
LRQPEHAGIQQWVRDLNAAYRNEPALWQIDFAPDGFEWIERGDAASSVIAFLRRGREPGRVVLVICNFTPVPHMNYQVGVLQPGFWRERLNSDAREYGGSGVGNAGGVQSNPAPAHGRMHSLTLTIPPLAMLLLTCD